MNKASVIIVLYAVVLALGQRNDGMAMNVVKSDQREDNTGRSFHPPSVDHVPIEPVDSMDKTHPKERPIPAYHPSAVNEHLAYDSTPLHGRPFPHPSYQGFQLNGRPYSAYQSSPLNEKPNYAHNSTPLNGRPNHAYQRPDAFPRPIDEHIMSRPPPMLDADMHYVHYNVYRPTQDRNNFPHIVSDQHVIPRPSIPGIQNYFGPNRGNGNFVLNHNSVFSNQIHRPLTLDIGNIPNTYLNAEQDLLTRLPIRPGFQNVPATQINNDNKPPVSISGLHIPSGAPMKPGFVILANNVFIHPPMETYAAPRPLPFNPPSLIRFDNGRDHHVNTVPIKIENNIEFVEIPKSPLFNKGFMTTWKQDYVSKPYTHSVDKGIDVTSMKPGDINAPENVNKGQYNKLDNSNQSVLQSTMIKIEETDAQFHPMMSPLTTLTPKETPLAQTIAVALPSSATDGTAIKDHEK